MINDCGDESIQEGATTLLDIRKSIDAKTPQPADHDFEWRAPFEYSFLVEDLIDETHGAWDMDKIRDKYYVTSHAIRYAIFKDVVYCSMMHGINKQKIDAKWNFMFKGYISPLIKRNIGPMPDEHTTQKNALNFINRHYFIVALRKYLSGQPKPFAVEDEDLNHMTIRSDRHPEWASARLEDWLLRGDRWSTPKNTNTTTDTYTWTLRFRHHLLHPLSIIATFNPTSFTFQDDPMVCVQQQQHQQQGTI